MSDEIYIARCIAKAEKHLADAARPDSTATQWASLMSAANLIQRALDRIMMSEETVA